MIIDLIDLINFVETVEFMYDPSPFEDLLQDSGTILETLYDIMNLHIPFIDINKDVILRLFFDQRELLSYSFSELIALGSESYHIMCISEWADEDLHFNDAKGNLIRDNGELPGICDEVYDDLNAYSPEGV